MAPNTAHGRHAACASSSESLISLDHWKFWFVHTNDSLVCSTLGHIFPLLRLQACNSANTLVAEQQAAGTSADASAAGFDFKRYMAQRAELVNRALDASVPIQYPELVNESMR